MNLTVGRSPGPTRETGTRGFWPLRDLPGVLWMIAVVVVSALHPLVPAPRWLMIHLFVLGAAGHSILVWSRYFADTLLRLPTTPRAQQTPRLLVFNLGVLSVVLGVPTGWWWLVAAGAAGVAAAVAWHVISLALGLRSRFSSRFSATVHFYIAAGILLLAGVVLGAWIARDPGEPLETRLRMTHIGLNLLGFIGLTVIGTVVTLGPTMLRTRIPDGAERRARLALALMFSGIALVAAAALVDRPEVIVVALLGYAAGVGVVLRDLARAARAKPPTSYPTWSLLAGLLWFVGLLVALAAGIAGALHGGSSDAAAWAALGRPVEWLTPYLAAGFVAQVLLGALSYLVPVVMGGGPAAVRAMNRDLDAGGALRVTVVNTGLLVCVLPVPSVVRVLSSALVLVGLASFVPILLRAIRRRHRGQADTSLEALERPAGQVTGLAAVGLVAVVLSVALGAAVDPSALDGPVTSAAGGVTPTGSTTEVRVEAADMRFTPSRIEVPAGDRLVITVVNTDDSDVHDLVLETGHDSGRLAPGDEATIEVGVVGRDLDGWCSVVGHRQMGMVLEIVAVGAGSDGPEQATPERPTPGTSEHEMPGHTTDHSMPKTGDPSADAPIVDPVLPPVAPGRVHRYTIRATEQEAEVAPGVVQRRWTYNGTVPGPTLHGKVGDIFVVTFVNDGTMGHSIDFHAGVRAPDEVMRTIPPGESLTYRFTAERAGIWMYHCSTMPMSAHIAAGLFGAVVIDPPDLPEVDRSFLLVQSEHYYGEDGADMDKINAEQPDAVVFNGYADGYAHRPLRVRAGERVRIWLLNAGPGRPLSFHVVGGQFDATYAEGRWLLGDPAAPASSGGAQALALLPAQGGFVELRLDEPGSYRLVNHVMVDAERGAYGTLEVVP
ncbi:multicopper oxidase domain-containing protein [Nocardioides daejeonensis]|uniref:multicopper oxidase domain-containing protein n=1 Tax=Nocardioides daejeonensis TaxID=1046556 RepID=UPI000D7400F9|nr:multicopper oxidase domain-containing protein [Nocardioides daejeonensis]